MVAWKRTLSNSGHKYQASITPPKRWPEPPDMESADKLQSKKLKEKKP